MSKIWGMHFSWKKTAGGSLPRSTWVLSIQTISSEITAKNAAAEHVGQFSVKFISKIVEILAWLSCPKSGGCIFPGKNRRRQPTPEHMGFLSGKIQDGLHGMASWQRPILAKQALYQNMVLVLIGVYMAPN